MDEARVIWNRCDGEAPRVELVDAKDLGLL
jgi:hypothetical protein